MGEREAVEFLGRLEQITPKLGFDETARVNIYMVYSRHFTLAKDSKAGHDSPCVFHPAADGKILCNVYYLHQQYVWSPPAQLTNTKTTLILYVRTRTQ
jgi:hypothetical protein